VISMCLESVPTYDKYIANECNTLQAEIGCGGVGPEEVRDGV
jgi:hypothetical protein